MRILILLFVLLFSRGLAALSQGIPGQSGKVDTVALNGPAQPLFFVDSVRVDCATGSSFQPNEIATMTVFRDSNATRLAGNDAKNGLIYIISKTFARSHYWKYFSSRSAAYKKAAPDLQKESAIVYILDGKVVKEHSESDLFDVNDENFRDLKVIDGKMLKDEYGVSDKMVGVVIRTKPKEKK